MPSLFPGMDPYIESCGLWEDFHQELLGEIKAQLARELPSRYVVRLGERAYVTLLSSDEFGIERHASQADVAIAVASRRLPDKPRDAVAVLDQPLTAADVEPIEMRAFVEVEFRETFVEISEREPRRRLVTTIELLSPSNKRRETTGWTRYLRKRQAHLEGGANLVEIDLLRQGTRMPMEAEWPDSPYYLLVCRREKAPLCTVWPAHFTCPLPVISVPLSAPDPDVPLTLQGILEEVYDRSRYEFDIDYHQPCTPPLDPATATWLADRLRGPHEESRESLNQSPGASGA